eukprot:6718368-Prymnesium_polylepis.1
MRRTPTWQSAGVARSSPRSSAAMVLLCEHLATDAEAVNRGMATQSSDVIFPPGPGEQYSSPRRVSPFAGCTLAAEKSTNEFR